MNLIGEEFEWNYQDLSDTNIYSANDIKLSNISSHMLVVKKNVLQYGKMYMFTVSCKF